MHKMIRLTVGALTVSTLLASVGCVPQDKYDNLLTANRSLKEQIVVVEDERDEAMAGMRSLQGKLGSVQGSYTNLQGRYDTMDESFRQMESQNDDYLRRIAQLEMGPLPVAIESALEDLARAHPEMLSFDSNIGMLRFASDFTFGLGSTELSDNAMNTLRALAPVLNSAEGKQLEARIVGHTDNVRISRPETRRNHPTNMHLSVHRAISVRDALVEAGVDAVRLQVAGYGEFRPIVMNPEKGGAAENRRVEIFLIPLPPMMDLPAAVDEPAIEAPAEEPMTDEPMK